MGLDQYAYATAHTLKQIEHEEKPMEQIAYWRKHNRLQGFMQNLYESKGGTMEFNCIYLELDEDDINYLEECVKDESLPKTPGFFFGNDSYNDYEDRYKQVDIDFIERARQSFEQGLHVYYYCWW